MGKDIKTYLVCSSTICFLEAFLSSKRFLGDQS